MNVEQIGKLAIEGQLLNAGQFEEQRQSWLEQGGTADDGSGFARGLVDQGILTEFQAEALQAGIIGPYRLGPYQLHDRLTVGAMWHLFRAEQVEFTQTVSLKVFPATLSRDEQQFIRFGREARVGLEVDHPNVVKTYQVGKVGEVPFIALEELSGESLQQRLTREGRLPFGTACQLFHQAAEGLAYLHSVDIFHRDLRPANLWITAQGVVKIMEFGAALDPLAFVDEVDESGDNTGTTTDARDNSCRIAAGFYDYMSAEQAEDEQSASATSDLYSLGCTLYHCLTGQVPFPDKNPVRQMLRHARATPQVLFDFDHEIPDTVQEIVSRLLAKQPQDRFESAAELATSLAEIVAPQPLPEIDPVNREFLVWLQTAQSDDISEYEPEFQDFLSFVSDARFNATMSGRPTF